jgi:hypothetical protein
MELFTLFVEVVHGPSQTGVRPAAPDSGGVFKNTGSVTELTR